MHLREIESVLSVYYFRSFSEAANQTSTSLSTISKHVSHVEEELGVRLFERKTKSSETGLTREGAQIIPLFAQMIGTYESILDIARTSHDGHEAPLQIGYTPIFGTVGESQAIANFCMQHPEYSVHPAMGYSRELFEQLASGKIDGAFFVLLDKFRNYREEWELEGEQGLSFIPTTRTTHMSLAMSSNHRLAHRSEILAKELVGEHFIYSATAQLGIESSGIDGADNRIEALAAKLGVPRAEIDITYLDFRDRSLVMDIVAKGNAVVPFVSYLGQDYPGINVARISDWEQAAVGAFVYRTAVQSPAFEAFKSCVRETAKTQARICDRVTGQLS